MNGFELIAFIRAKLLITSERLPAAIALTAFRRYEDQQRALRYGYQTHLVKPASRTELVTTIRKLLKAS